MNDNIKIMVCCHKKCEIPLNSIFMPIQVGKKISKVNLDIQSDCELENQECENISEYNSLFSEMTAFYWAWKNIRSIYPKLEYIGLCHYRRYFRSKVRYVFFKKILLKCNEILKIITGYKQDFKLFDSPEMIVSVNSKKFNNDMNRLRKIINNNDIVYGQPTIYINNSVKQCFEVIGRSYIRILEEIVFEYYNEYYQSLEQVLNGKTLISANMVILKCEYLDEYCEFVFGVLEKHINYLVENKHLTRIDENIFFRVPGYLAELLTATYVEFKKAKGFKTKPVGRYFVESYFKKI